MLPARVNTVLCIISDLYETLTVLRWLIFAVRSGFDRDRYAGGVRRLYFRDGDHLPVRDRLRGAALQT